MTAPDYGLTTGMSVCFLRDDLESAASVAARQGFEALEVFGGHLAPGLPGVVPFEGHASAAGEVIRRAGLVVSTLNVVGADGFDPYTTPETFGATVELMSAHMRLAAAMGSPRILIWEGRLQDSAEVPDACSTLARCIETAARRSGLSDPPRVSVELHPFTFGLAHQELPQLARALTDVGAGICLDFCHFGVALGVDFLDVVQGEVLDAINHVHYSDTDLITSELHFPPGEGVIDFDAIARRIAGSRLSIAWDLFGWPGPRHAIADHLPTYREFVTTHVASSRVP